MSNLGKTALLAASSICWILAGCVPTLPQKVRAPDTTVPTGYGNRSADKTNSAGEKAREFFDDPQLRALIDTALQHNQELNLLLQEIRVTKYEVMARKGEYLPKLGLGASAGLEKVGKYTSQGASDETTQYEPGKTVPEHLQNYAIGLSASWEVDIWKKLRNATKSAMYRYLSTVEGRNFMVTQLVAEIAKSYYELMALDNRLSLVRQNIEILESALETVKLQKEAGRATELAVQRFQAEVLKNKSDQYELTQEIVKTENRINFLVGRFPKQVARNSDKFRELSPKVVHTGLAAQLLENRPDVKQAEMQLVAAKLDVKVARAYFYPSLSIEAGVGYEAFALPRLVTTPESLFYNLAGNLTAPLLNRKGITARYFSASAKQMQAVYAYERTILKAYMEVANQVAAIDNLEKRYELKTKQVDTLAQSVEVSGRLFNSARADYMEVLLTRRDALESQLELIETKQKQLSAVVSLYQALGGGWR